MILYVFSPESVEDIQFIFPVQIGGQARIAAADRIPKSLNPLLVQRVFWNAKP